MFHPNRLNSLHKYINLVTSGSIESKMAPMSCRVDPALARHYSKNLADTIIAEIKLAKSMNGGTLIMPRDFCETTKYATRLATEAVARNMSVRNFWFECGKTIECKFFRQTYPVSNLINRTNFELSRHSFSPEYASFEDHFNAEVPLLHIDPCDICADTEFFGSILNYELRAFVRAKGVIVCSSMITVPGARSVVADVSV